MDGSGGLGIRNWPYYSEPVKGGLDLHLTPSVANAEQPKPFFSNAGFLQRIAASSVPMELGMSAWINFRDSSKLQHAMHVNHGYGALADASAAAYTLQRVQPCNLPKDSMIPDAKEHPLGPADMPLKKRHQGPHHDKVPKPKKPKKVSATAGETTKKLAPGAGIVSRSSCLVINGIDLDISSIPTPVCSCTGNPQQCYRWGMGGWQSACCTTGMSIYPLPVNVKRRGGRIAGRKMSLGTFKKVLEMLAGEGYNLSNPIDLKAHWAKHGTNKFVTIR